LSFELLRVEKITQKSDIPFELLLLADETVEAIDRYVHDSDCYVVRMSASSEQIAAFVLQGLNEREIELKNLAVSTNLQRRGIGTRIITEIRKIVKEKGYSILWVGTPDVAFRQVSFYEKSGFHKAGLKVNFFIENYQAPIFDHGVQLKDMLLLKLTV